jgi:hypothetical protein
VKYDSGGGDPGCSSLGSGSLQSISMGARVLPKEQVAAEARVVAELLQVRLDMVRRDALPGAVITHRLMQ